VINLPKTDKNPNGGQQFEVVDNGDPDPREIDNIVALEAAYDQVIPNSWMMVQVPGSEPVPAKVQRPRAGIGIARYGMSGKTTEIALGSPADPTIPVNWFQGRLSFSALRGTEVWAQAEALELAELPLTDKSDPVGTFKNKETKSGGSNTQPAGTPASDSAPTAARSIELDGYFDGLEAGRFVLVAGERADVAGVSVSEVAQIAGVQQLLDTSLPDDTLHTQLFFALGLKYGYKRATVKINANVVHATHGETQKEVLGSGDAGKLFMKFKLAKPPLTYLSEPTPSGAESTLQVRVNDILWHEAPNPAILGPNDRKYIIDIQDDETTQVTFGDGSHGVRLPTGVENVRAVYRSGIGKGGNVVPGKINMLPSPPLGVMSVANPAAATGGADAETRDQARRNAPIAVLALDRLVSVRDYADFARTYAGVAKANSSLADGIVNVTIAGVDDIPIDKSSDLFNNLLASMLEFGDPHQPVKLDVRELKILVLQAVVDIDPDYDSKVVSSQITASLLDRFGFDRLELGQAVILTQVISVIQNTPGVLYVEVEHFGAIEELTKDKLDPGEITKAVNELGKPSQAVNAAPNQISYFSPDLPETIVLKNRA
jgi:hypothetical protein